MHSCGVTQSHRTWGGGFVSYKHLILSLTSQWQENTNIWLVTHSNTSDRMCGLTGVVNRFVAPRFFNDLKILKI